MKKRNHHKIFTWTLIRLVFVSVVITAIQVSALAQGYEKDDGSRAFAQKDSRFRYGAVHKIKDRESYSVFYPVGTNEYKGVTILIHADQSSNPKSYGDLILELLNKNCIVIFPSYQSFGYSNNKSDIESISSALYAAYEDISINVPTLMSLPVAYIGHSMGGIIAFELALGFETVPKKPSCVISLAPAEVSSHKLDQMNFDLLDIYDVYLILEEYKDKHYRKNTGGRIMQKLVNAERKKHLIHHPKEHQKSKHMNAWAHNSEINSKNNGMLSYFSWLFGRTTQADKEYYWPEIGKALDCAFERDGCNLFREKKVELRSRL